MSHPRVYRKRGLSLGDGDNTLLKNGKDIVRKKAKDEGRHSRIKRRFCRGIVEKKTREGVPSHPPSLGGTF